MDRQRSTGKTRVLLRHFSHGLCGHSSCVVCVLMWVELEVGGPSWNIMRNSSDDLLLSSLLELRLINWCKPISVAHRIYNLCERTIKTSATRKITNMCSNLVTAAHFYAVFSATGILFMVRVFLSFTYSFLIDISWIHLPLPATLLLLNCDSLL